MAPFLGLSFSKIYTSFWQLLLHPWKRLCNLFIPLFRPSPKEKPDNDVEKSAITGTDNKSKVHIERVNYITVAPGCEPRSTCEGDIVIVTKGKIIGFGYAIIELLPSGHVVKSALPHPKWPEEHRQRMDLEARIYQAVGEHPRIPKLIDWDPDNSSLSIEYLGGGTLKEYITENPDLPLHRRLQLATQATEGVSVLHSANVIHCDISPRNFVLGSDGDLRILDFGGSSIAGSRPYAIPDSRYQRPGTNFNAAAFQDDLFSLGSLIYFILKGRNPFGDISSEEVEQRFAEADFPDLAGLPASQIIEGCWRGNLKTALKIFNSLQSLYANVEQCTL